MRNLFLEKNIVQKLIIAVIVILLFNFSAPTIANAESFVGKKIVEMGGELLQPIMKLFVLIGDGIINILQSNMIDDVPVVIGADSSELDDDERWLEEINKCWYVDGFGCRMYCTISSYWRWCCSWTCSGDK